MSQKPGNNLPGFREVQLEFAAHIRHPHLNPVPAGIEPRRMKIYANLFFNNIENFLATTFPITKSLLSADHWHEMTRDFVHRHISESPYFLEIPQEFLVYLNSERKNEQDPPFLLELCHYEWVELALDVADEALPSQTDSGADLLSNVPVLSPLVWVLSYLFPVHLIGPGFKPENPPEQPTLLVVYRTRSEEIGFRELSPVSFRLLTLLANQAKPTVLATKATQAAYLTKEQPPDREKKLTGLGLLHALHNELPGSDLENLIVKGREALNEFRDWGIILGSYSPSRSLKEE